MIVRSVFVIVRENKRKRVDEYLGFASWVPNVKNASVYSRRQDAGRSLDYYNKKHYTEGARILELVCSWPSEEKS